MQVKGGLSIQLDESVEALIKKLEMKGKKVTLQEHSDDESVDFNERVIGKFTWSFNFDVEIDEFEEENMPTSKAKIAKKKSEFNSSQKDKLQQMVSDLEHKLVQKDNALDDIEKNKVKKLRKIQLALK